MDHGVRTPFTVGPDAPIVENERGGKQSHVAYRYDLIPPEVLERIARIFDYGAQRYEPNNWKLISIDEHLNHAFTHMIAYRLGDTNDDHLGHAAWRLLAAYWAAMRDGYDARQPDEKEQVDVIKQEEIIKPYSTIKFCTNCSVNEVRHSLAGYCDECHNKIYGEK